MSLLRPPPAGTKLLPWFPQLVFTPICRGIERAGVYIHNRVIHPSEIGLRAKEYNPKVHGPYQHHVWYGKPDVALFDAKVSDLPAWFGRRDKSFRAIYAEITRNVFRARYYYQYGAVYGSFLRTLWRVILLFCFANWLVKFPRYWDFRRTIYHW